MQCRAMVMTLGGKIEPIVKSICYSKPDFICFLVSEQSLNTRTSVLELIGYHPITHTVITEDPQSIINCYEKALECIDYIQKRGYSCADTVIDITGGTKPMTGGLAVAAAYLGFRFHYVGGTQREAGSGTVVSGTEQIISNDNFINLFAIEERKQIKLLFNRAQYGGARTVAELAAAKARADLAVFFRALKQLIAGYEHWDRFEHNKGRAAIKEGLQDLEQYLTIQPRYKDQFEPFLAGVRENLVFLNEIAGQSKGGCRICSLFVLDLLANAQRRALEGSYDDASARLYSAIEQRAHVLLLEDYKIDSSNVNPDQIPDSLRTEYQERYCGRDGVIRIPLMACYRLLAELGEPCAQKVIADSRLNDLMAARNGSILAHGTTPIGPDTYRKLFDIALDLAGVEEVSLPKVPELDI